MLSDSNFFASSETATNINQAKTALTKYFNVSEVLDNEFFRKHLKEFEPVIGEDIQAITNLILKKSGNSILNLQQVKFEHRKIA